MRIFLKIIILLVFLALAILRQAGISQNHSPITAESTATSVKDSLNGYEINHPADWQVKPTPGSKSLVKLNMMDPTGKFGLQLRVYPSRNIEMEIFLDWYAKDFKKDMKDPIELARGDFNAGDAKGKFISFDGRKRNKYFLKSYLFANEKKVIVLQGGCPFIKKDTLEAELDKIAASLKLLD